MIHDSDEVQFREEPFSGFPKIARFNRTVVVTEKIAGTNAQVYITPNGQFYVGSRNRWITPENDNFGFARWAYDRKDELMQLGPGRHFGEWWGSGIQRGYGFKNGERFFSLFNTVRWCLHDSEPQPIPTGDPRITKTQDVLPACCGLVPVLWSGVMAHLDTDYIMTLLQTQGSMAVQGFMNPEGIVIFHTASNTAFKMTYDDNHKG